MRREAREDAIREEAARWAVWADRGVGTDSERAEFQAWLLRPDNAEAFDVANQAMDVFGEFDSADFPEIEALRSEALEYAPRPRRWLPLAGLALAASVAGVIGISIVSTEGARMDRPAPARNIAQAVLPKGAPVRGNAGAGQVSSYATAVGEQRIVTLADGTRVTMNTGTQIAVIYTAQRRVVRLLRGQALFDVFHNANRPFSVVAGDRQVTALGTIFEVSVDQDDFRVTLVTGRVVVGRSPGREEDAPEALPTYLSPGQQFVAPMGRVAQVRSIDVNRELLWRQSLVEFSNATMASAVSELNRYSSRPIVLADEQVSALRISGVYHTGQPEEFVDLVSKMLPVGARENKRGEIELYSLQPGAS